MSIFPTISSEIMIKLYRKRCYFQRLDYLYMLDMHSPKCCLIGAATGWDWMGCSTKIARSEQMDIAFENVHKNTRPLDFPGGGFGCMKKVYCACGRIVDMDGDYFLMRMNLGKQVECCFCRNHRVGREIEELNNHFLGLDREDSGDLSVDYLC